MPPSAELLAQNQRLEKELVVAQGEVAALKAQVAWLRQQMFGGGKSETLDRAQILLKLEGLSVATPGAKVETVTYQRRQPTGEKRPVPAEIRPFAGQGADRDRARGSEGRTGRFRADRRGAHL